MLRPSGSRAAKTLISLSPPPGGDNAGIAAFGSRQRVRTGGIVEAAERQALRHGS